MSDENGGSSLLDDIIFMAMVMYVLYIVFLAIPIIPYFDVVLKIFFSIHIPNSFLGKIITGIVLFVIGFLMLETAKSIGEKMFADRTAMFLFLYGQGLVLIGLMGVTHTFWYISSSISALVSAGFNEPLEIGVWYLIAPGIVAIVLSFMIEDKPKNKKSKRAYITKTESKNLNKKYDIRDNVVIRGKLKMIKEANELLKKEHLSTYEWSIVEKARKYREQFSTEEMENIDETIKYYKQ